MIISKTPVRVSLGAGGTDLPGYYRKYGTSFATAAGSKYTYVMVNRHPEKVVWMGLQQAERVDHPRELKHRVVNQALRLMGLIRNIEVVSIADVPTNSGLGTSGSFVVGLLNALHAYKGEYRWPNELAAEASFLEHDLLGDRTGKQDQYAAALGGIIWMEISKKGSVSAKRMDLKQDFVDLLNERAAFFGTQIQRKSADLQVWEDRLIGGDQTVVETLKNIQGVSKSIRSALMGEDLEGLGSLLTLHWEHKQKLAANITDGFINSCFRLAMKSGAMGGNLMGAGGGGSFFFICKSKEAKRNLRKVMDRKGLASIDMSFEMRGSSVTEV